MSFDRPTFPAVALTLASLLTLLAVGCDSSPREMTDQLLEANPITEVDAFDVAVADLHDDPPPLFAAIADGEVARVRDLLAEGADVNQHDRVFGTPLIAALQSDNDDIVAVVLEAGADRDGTSGYFLAADELSKQATEPALRQVADQFAQQQELTLRHEEHQPALLLSNVPAGRGKALVNQSQAELIEQGWFLFRYAHDAQQRQDVIGLLPTSEKYVVLAYLRTDGVNYNISTERIIDWLQRLEEDHPFVLTEAGLDYVGGEFVKRISDPGKLAARMYAFCPDIVDQGVGTLVNLERELAKPSPALYLWWD